MKHLLALALCALFTHSFAQHNTNPHAGPIDYQEWHDLVEQVIAYHDKDGHEDYALCKGHITFNELGEPLIAHVCLHPFDGTQKNAVILPIATQPSNYSVRHIRPGEKKKLVAQAKKGACPTISTRTSILACLLNIKNKE